MKSRHDYGGCPKRMVASQYPVARGGRMGDGTPEGAIALKAMYLLVRM